MAETTPGPAPVGDPDPGVEAPLSPVDALFQEHGTGEAVVNALLNAIVGGKLAEEVRGAGSQARAWRAGRAQRAHSPAGLDVRAHPVAATAPPAHVSAPRATSHATQCPSRLLLAVPPGVLLRRDASYAD